LNAPSDALPAAVGIDVNFHKPGGGMLNLKVEEEARFLELCLEADAKLATSAGVGTLPESVGKGVPQRDAVRSNLPHADAATRAPPHREKTDETGEEQPSRVLLGVSRALSDPAETWIALPRYTRLAASIDVPEDVYARSYARFHIPGQPELRAMGLALAEAYSGEIRAKHPLWGTELFGEEAVVKQTAGELHCLDFGRLDSLRRHVVTYGQVMRGAVDADAVKDRILLLGDVRNATIEDAFTIPGRTRPLPGVLLHTLSAETLVQGPLFEFKPAVSLALEVGFEIVAMLCLVVLPAIYGRRLRPAESLGALVRLFTILFVVAALSLWALGALQILWLEAFSVAVGLALSPYVEAALVGVVGAVRGHAAAISEPAITEPEGAAHGG
jgi:hypothetical protein